MLMAKVHAIYPVVCFIVAYRIEPLYDKCIFFKIRNLLFLPMYRFERQIL